MQMRAIPTQLCEASHITEHRTEHEDDHQAYHLAYHLSNHQIQTQSDPQSVLQTVHYHRNVPQDDMHTSQEPHRSDCQIHNQGDAENALRTIQDNVQHNQNDPHGDLQAFQDPHGSDHQTDQDILSHHQTGVAEEVEEHEDYEVYVLQGTSSDVSAETQAQVNGILSQMEVLKEHLENDRVRHLLLPHVSETLSQLITQCTVVTNAQVVEVTDEQEAKEESNECKPHWNIIGECGLYRHIAVMSYMMR